MKMEQKQSEASVHDRNLHFSGLYSLFILISQRQKPVNEKLISIFFRLAWRFFASFRDI